MSMSSITYNGYECMIGFTGSISGAYVGAEYRLALYNSGTIEPIWHGSLQTYQSASIDKAVYENQIPPVISHQADSTYIILT